MSPSDAFGGDVGGEGELGGAGGREVGGEVGGAGGREVGGEGEGELGGAGGREVGGVGEGELGGAGGREVGGEGESEVGGAGGREVGGEGDVGGSGDRLPAHPPGAGDAGGRRRGDRAPGLGGLLTEAVDLFRSHLWMFVGIAGGVAAVVNLILGFGLGELASRYHEQTSQSVGFIKLAAAAAVTTPLITAMLARAVLDIRAGEAPSASRAVQAGLDLFAPILLTILLYIGAVFAGFLLIVPGIYLGVSWYFVAQAVVVDGRRGVGALARSGELVKGNWWRALAAGLLFNIIVAVPSQLLNVAFDAAARAADAEGVLVVGEIVFQAFSLPFVAIGATLFYLRLRDEPRPVATRR